MAWRNDPASAPGKAAVPRSLFALSFLLLLVFPRVIHAEDDRSVASLRKIGQQVQQVVRQNMDACVAITDGAGFGSGVIVSEDGLILTAGHVMMSTGRYEVILPTGRTVRAVPLGKNLDVDAGMMQIIDDGPFPFVEINRDEDLRLGQWVVCLGHSGGYELGRTPPVRTGRILASDREQLFTDAVLIGGDSGGPLFDLDGRLIGIHSSIGDTIAENRHVSMRPFLADWKRLQDGKQWGRLPDLDRSEAKRGLLGIRVDLTSENCRVKSVGPGSPAEDAGLLPDDIVIEFENEPIRDGRHLIERVKEFRAGDVCELLVRRRNKTLRFEVMLQ